MTTKKIIHSTPAQEAKQAVGCVGLVVVFGVISLIYTTVHKLWEYEIPRQEIGVV